MMYYLTTPIFYVNGAPHIGHAYTALAADVIARFKRLDGYEVHFLTGTDEHGQKVEKAARDAGLDPQAFTDEISGKFQAMLAMLGVSNDDFIRTTEPRHNKGATALWEKLAASGHIYLGHYEGFYAVRDEDFYAESDLTTQLPVPAFRVPGPASGALRGKSGLCWSILQAQRNAELYPPRIERSFGEPLELHMGHSGAG